MVFKHFKECGTDEQIHRQPVDHIPIMTVNMLPQRVGVVQALCTEVAMKQMGAVEGHQQCLLGY